MVEDMDETRRLLEITLAGAPFEVVFGVNGVDGIGLYRQARDAGRPFDLVVTDVMMPDSSGLGLGEAIRAEGDSTTPIILLTAFDMDTIGVARITLIGVRAVLSKPGAIVGLRENLCAELGLLADPEG